VLSLFFAAALSADSKSEAALRLQLEAAQRATIAAQQATAAERDARLKTEAQLAEAAKERAALAATIAKDSTATHSQIAAGQANAKTVAAGVALDAKDEAAEAHAQQRDATDTIISGQAEQSAKTDILTRAVDAKYGFYQSLVPQIPATLAFLGAMLAASVSILNRRAGAKAAVVAAATHSLVNSQYGGILSICAALARRVADLTGKRPDVEQADRAEADLKRHEEQQARVDAGAAIAPQPQGTV
jgi:hypothetical protein